MASCIIATQNKQETQCKLYYIAVAVILRSFILGQSRNKCHFKFTTEADSLLGNPKYQEIKQKSLSVWYLKFDVVFNKSSMILGLLPTTFTLFLGSYMISSPASFYKLLGRILGHYVSGCIFAQDSFAVFKSIIRSVGS